MSVIDPAELEESSLADLHAIASELGIEGYRRLRKEELIAAIVASQGGEPAPAEEAEDAVAEPDEPSEAEEVEEPDEEPAEEPEAAEELPKPEEPQERRSGYLDVLQNGSAFLRVDGFGHSRDDVYVSPAQIRRCELRPGDEVEGPVRPPRRSERHPSLVHVETVNGADAEPPAERPHFRALTATFATERLPAPEGLEATPYGKGSRVAIGGPPGAGASATLRRIASTLEGQEGLELTVVLAGARPEEVTDWRRGSSAPVVGGSFDSSPERLADEAAMAVERAKRAAERGGDAVLVVDSLDALPPAAARRIFGAARNTEEAGSVTIFATTGLAAEPQRQATTRIVLEPGPDVSGDEPRPRLSDEASGTLRAELLG